MKMAEMINSIGIVKVKIGLGETNTIIDRFDGSRVEYTFDENKMELRGQAILLEKGERLIFWGKESDG